MRTHPSVGILILCRSQGIIVLQSVFTKYIFTSDLLFFLNFGKCFFPWKKYLKALSASMTLCFTDLLLTSLTHLNSGLLGMNSLLSHLENSMPGTKRFSFSYTSLL